MKKAAIALAVAGAFAAPLSAGTLEEAVMDEPMIIEETAQGSLSATAIVLTMGLLILAGALHDN